MAAEVYSKIGEIGKNPTRCANLKFRFAALT
jgi:hypothetical protein